MAEILSGARKYRIGLDVAHHELHQLQRSSEVASAVMTHPYTRIVFRVGDEDAKKLAGSFSDFDAEDIKNLETGQALCRVERSNYDFNLSIPLPELPSEEEMAARQQDAITASRAAYGTPRAEVEAMLRQAWEVEANKPERAKPKPPPDEPFFSPPIVEPIASVLPPTPKAEFLRIRKRKPLSRRATWAGAERSTRRSSSVSRRRRKSWASGATSKS